MATMTAGMFLRLCEPHLAKVWFDEGQQRPLQYASVFNVGSLDELYIEEAKMTGFGQLQPQGEGEAIQYDEAIAPITKRWDYVDYALGYKVTDKLVRNERYGQVQKLEGALKKSADDTTETFAFALLNYADATTIATGFDGLALASAAHTRMDGGPTQSNSLNTALSLAGLQDGIIAFRKLKNDRGRPEVKSPKKLYIPADLMLTAEELLQSPMKPSLSIVGAAGDDRNAINVVGRYGLTPEVLDYLTSSTWWALVSPEHDLRFAWRYKAETAREVDFDTNSIKNKVRQGMLRGFGEWKGFLLGHN